MKRITIQIAIASVILAGCASSSLYVEHESLSAARAAIAQAKQARAERCAPELLAKAVSRMYWAAHEISEGGHQEETTDLIAEAEEYAAQAKTAAANNCEAETTVILLPDEDGQVGTVSVHAGGISQHIDKPFHYTSVSGRQAKPKAIRDMGEENVKRRFSSLLKAQPRKPARFILYFMNGTSELTEASRAMIPDVLRAAKVRYPSEVSIVGHTDATGSEALNLKISSKRARAVESLIKAADMPPESIYLRFHGENDPLVATPDNVPEPRNRRVEILIL